jgi:hypothetical protein
MGKLSIYEDTVGFMSLPLPSLELGAIGDVSLITRINTTYQFNNQSCNTNDK